MNTRSILTLFISVLFLTACSSGEQENGTKSSSSPSSSDGLTEFQEKHGIGPYTEEISLGELDQTMVAEGDKIFEQNCSACHKMDERYVGPELGDVLNRRSATFVMNMILNPDGMVKKHPEVKAMLAQYYTPMPNQNLSEDQARAVLEYLRSETN